MVTAKQLPQVVDGPKRDDYEWFGIGEYWRFDESGASHGARLAGDRLVAGVYEPIELAAGDNGSLRGYSAVLDVELQWRAGHLEWLDPRTGRHIPIFLEERARAESADRRAEAERARAEKAEEHLRRLKEELRGLRGE